MSDGAAQPVFCPRCVADRPPGSRACPRCGFDLTGEEIPRLRQIWLERRRLDSEWTELVGRISSRAAARRQQPVTPAWVAEAQPYRPTPASAAEAPAESTPRGVQNTLLTLGAILCAVAALLFIAVAWGHVGLAGRAVIMLGVTAIAAVSAQFAARRGLKATAEAVTGIAYFLLWIDAASAYSFDLFDLRSLDPLAYWAGALLVIGTIGALHRASSSIALPGYAALLVLQLPLALVLGQVGADAWAFALGLSVQVVAVVAVSEVLRRQRLLGLSAVALAIAAFIATWVAFVAMVDAAVGDGWDRHAGLVFVAAMSVAAVAAGREKLADLRGDARALAAIALTLDAAALIVHTWNGSAIPLGIALVGGAIAAVALATRQSFVPGLLWIGLTTVVAALLTTSPGILTITAFTFEWTGALVDSTVAKPWRAAVSPAWTVDLPLTLVLAVAAVVFTWTGLSHAPGTGGRRAFLVPATTAVIAAVEFLLFVYEAPFAVSIVAVTALTTALVLTAVFRVRDATTRSALVTLAVLLGVQSLLWSAATDASAIGVVAWALLVTTYVGVRSRSALPLAGALAVAELARLVVAWAVVVSAGSDVTGLILVIVGSAVVSVVLLAVRAPNVPAVAIPAIAVAIAVIAVGMLLATADAGLLSISFVVLAASSASVAALTPMRMLGWLSAVFSLAFVWLRLAMAEVDVVEAYTLPAAALALFAGYRGWRRLGGLPSEGAFGPALLLGFGPTIVALLVGAGWLRAFCLLVAGLATVLIGARLLLRAPLVAGSLAVLTVTWVTTEPYFHLIPQWLAIGAAGLLLVGVGATWEARRRNFEALAGRYRQLK